MYPYRNIPGSRRLNRNLSRRPLQRSRFASPMQRRKLSAFAHAITELKVVYRLLITSKIGINSEMGAGYDNRAATGNAQIESILSSFPYADDAITLNSMRDLSYNSQASEQDVINALRVANNRVTQLCNRISLAQTNIDIAVDNFTGELQRRLRAAGSNINLS